MIVEIKLKMKKTKLKKKFTGNGSKLSLESYEIIAKGELKER